MTICLAALCDEGNSCVVAADRMAVFGAGSLLEFKQDDTSDKIHTTFGNSVLLHSGGNQDALAIVERLSTKDPKRIRTSLDEVIAELLAQKRDSTVSRFVGGGFNYEKFVTSASPTLQASFGEVLQQVRKLDLGDMLLVTPEEGKYYIHFLHPPELGVKSDLHYATIGSGGIYGRAALTIQQYSKSSKISEALFQVYSAKKAAEIVYGVGEPTDMAVLTKGQVIDVSSDTIAMLEKVRLKRTKFLLSDRDSEALAKLIGVN
jgi:hypothetical protein